MWFARQPRTQRSSGIVLLVDDEQRVHDEVRAALGDMPWTLRDAYCAAEAVRALESEEPIVLALVDLGLPGEDDYAGIVLLDALRRHDVQTLCVALTVSLRRDYINAVAGVGAVYLSKWSGWDMAATLKYLAKRALASRTLGENPLRRAVTRFCRDYRLSLRESELVCHVALDTPRAEIAARMGIAKGTLSTHVQRIFEKLPSDLRRLATIRRQLLSQARGGDVGESTGKIVEF